MLQNSVYEIQEPHNPILDNSPHAVEVVEQIMMEELTKAIGHPPTIKQEVWCKSNMVKHLETLKEKAKVVA